MKIQSVALSFLAFLAVAAVYACSSSDSSKDGSDDEIVCPEGYVVKNGKCAPDCKDNQHEENGKCVDDAPTPVQCPDSQHEENGQCVDDAPTPVQCPDNQHEENGKCVDNDPEAPADPCKNVTCEQGSCQQGICVTDAMKNIKSDDPCDTETFVEFCNGNTTVYCDQGFVQLGECDEGCAVYEETYFGRKKMQSGCVDGGSCAKLGELRRTCEVVNKKYAVVMATACQRTTSGELKYISVDGYYCMGACDAAGEKCELAEGECDPYDASNYSCEGTRLTQCYLSNALNGIKRAYPCEDACISVGGIAMCGKPCSDEGARSNACVYAESTTYSDLGDMVCVKDDSGELYSIWTRNYEYCDDGCDANSLTCK